jgi:hypothetical protein
MRRQVPSNADRLAPPGQRARPVIEISAGGVESRTDVRRRTRLRSAKILDGANAFLCEALIQDRSAGGLRLALARNIGLPVRFGVHDDITGEIVIVATVWRRGLTLGGRVLQRGPAAPLKPSERFALRGRYYGVPD